MKTKVSRSARWFATLPLLAVGGSAAFLACDGEFEYESCPEGTVQVAGGGDVSDACKPPTTAGQGGEGGSLGGGGQGGESGSNAGGGQGGGGQSGGGQGGGGALSPVCTAGATKCSNDAQDTCDEAGQWGGPKGCDIGCDPAGSKCVVPVQLAAGSEVTCALLSDKTIRCWGKNRYGKLGLGYTDEARVETKPVTVPGLGNIRSVFVDAFRICALTNDSTAYCWGSNDYETIVIDPNGQTPNFFSPRLLEEKNFFDLGLGSDHLCSIGTGASLRCRGRRQSGRLGDNSTTGQSGQFVSVIGFEGQARSVRAGTNHTCALSEAGEVFCWGFNSSGQLGQGADRESSAVAVKAKGNAVNVAQLVIGNTSTCALRADSSIVCWGDNYDGNLGRGYYEQLSSEPGTPDFVVGLSGVSQIDSNFNHSCALKRDGSLWCWGGNSFGQLGNDCSAAPCEVNPALGRTASHTPMLVPLNGVQSVASGNGHTCALTNDSAVYCWGRNDSGQLGNGEVSVASVPTPTRVIWK
jgi:alpha-tubulin suppressor-like RCC1 family protein